MTVEVSAVGPAEVSPHVSGVALQPAGFWIRAAARMLDWGVLGFVSLVIGVVLMIFAGALEAATGRPAQHMIESMEKMTLIGWIGSVLATIVYHALFECVAGATVGKRLLGLQVIAFDGTPLRFVQTAKRSVAFLVDAMFFGAIGAHEMSDSPEKQRIGDRWAETRVVRRRSLPPESHPSTMQFVAGLVSAVQTAALITLVTALLDYVQYVRQLD